jgi:hypothetical protein
VLSVQSKVRVEWPRSLFQAFESLYLLDKRDVVALEQDLPDLASLLWCAVFLLECDFYGVVDNQVHELIESLDIVSIQRDTC